ncbi:hypothetical protein L6164_008509 [Bauhinia variegata]|uniref:Uncharacterized protein n=1 Tax=Bauhinia variegata TaxID=167791 RepID=A0ACB9PG46_BAUVA|nr:hypothetical protein L6164_008509 [Bauhinia variegata]
MADEDLLHALFRCSSMSWIWLHYDLRFDLPRPSDDSFKEWLKRTLVKWDDKNEVRGWCLANHPFVKVNFDGDFDNLGAGGIGGIARGNNGEYLAAWTCKVDHMLNANIVEALALKIYALRLDDPSRTFKRSSSGTFHINGPCAYRILKKGAGRVLNYLSLDHMLETAARKMLVLSLVIDGVSQGLIVSERGMRQEDSLSLFLFLICVEGPSALPKQAGDVGNITRVEVYRGAPSISQLFFVKDSFFFPKASVAEGGELKRIGCYEACFD